MSQHHMRWTSLSLVLCALPAAVAAQSNPRFTTGGRTIFTLDLANTNVGDVPAGVSFVRGALEVVDKNGAHMLRAADESIILVDLPGGQVLPADFTVELDFISKQSSVPTDVGIEGTREIDQGDVSAYIEWMPHSLRITGGKPNDNLEVQLPPALAQATLGAMTRLAIRAQNDLLRVYTNGQLVLTASNRKFVRNSVLRVYLGGKDDNTRAVYLAGLRVIDNAPNGAAGAVPARGGPTTPGQVAATQPTLSSPTNPLPTVGASSTTSNQQPASGQTVVGGVAQSPTGIVAQLAGPSSLFTRDIASLRAGWGVYVVWSKVANATGYRVMRTVTGSGAPAVAVNFFPAPSANPAEMWVVDPYVLPSVDYTYWVEALLPNGGTTGSSPLSTVITGTPRTLVTNYNASVSGTKSVVGPGMLSVLGARPGSDVTWTWDVPPYAEVYNYEVSYELYGTVPGLGHVFERFTVPTVTNWANVGFTAIVPPLIRGVPQGMTVELCISPYADPDRTKPLPGPHRLCYVTQVP